MRRLCFLLFKRRELVWGQGTEAAVRAEVIVIVAPCLDGLAGLREAEEHVLVKALIAQLTIECFDEAFCIGLPGSQALAAEVVDYAQDAEAAPVTQSVGHEVERPALVARTPSQDRR